jgi:iron complex outermembrane receptor protein
MTDYFTLEVNGYYNVVFDLITLNQTQTYRLADMINNGRSRFQDDFAAFPLGQLNFNNEQQVFQQLGGEIGGRVFPIDGLDLYLNYAIHQTAPFGWEDSTSAFANDSRTSAHMVNAGFQYRSPIGLDVSADFSWQSEQTWVEQVLDTARGGVAFVPFRLPSYATLNARIGWRLFNDQLELAAVGTNLIDDGHREHPYGQRIDRRFMGFATVRF